ncbi:MAG: beta-propeller fold lactonase family protein [Myxococcales bacterium]|nr:beta-propeller fold lactonase family protein [Myxococcales bacterium]
MNYRQCLVGNAIARARVVVVVASAFMPGVLLATAFTALGACTADGDQVAPPDDAFTYPSALAFSRDGSAVFVVSANANLQYDSGTALVVDVAATEAAITPWLATRDTAASCYVDSEFAETMVCDEADFVRAGDGVRLGNFASAVTSLLNEAGDERVLFTVRGDPSITWADFDGERLACREAPSFSLCDLDRRLTKLGEGVADVHQTIFSEPYQIASDPNGFYAIATHFGRGAVTVVDARGAAPVLSDAVDGLFQRNLNTGVLSTSAVAIRPNYAQPEAPGIAYIGSSGEDRIQTAVVLADYYDQAKLLAADYFFVHGVGSNSGGGADTRGIAFDAHQRMYFVGRAPASVLQYDVSVDEVGQVRRALLSGVDTCRQATAIVVAAAGEETYVVVSCFNEGTIQVYRADPSLSLVATVSVGRGPAAMAISPDGGRIYVANYLDDTLAIVDTVPGSPTQFRVVMRMGVPRE